MNGSLTFSQSGSKVSTGAPEPAANPFGGFNPAAMLKPTKPKEDEETASVEAEATVDFRSVLRKSADTVE